MSERPVVKDGMGIDGTAMQIAGKTADGLAQIPVYGPDGKLLTNAPMSGLFSLSDVEGDFTATANNGTKTVTIASLNSKLTALDEGMFLFGAAYKVDTNGIMTALPTDKISIAGWVVTFENMAANFNATDTVRIVLYVASKAYSLADDALQVLQQNKVLGHCGGIVAHANYTLTGAFASVAGEMASASYSRLSLICDLAWTVATTHRFKVFGLHTSGGTGYPLRGFQDLGLIDGGWTLNMAAAAFDDAPANMYFQLSNNASQPILLTIDCRGWEFIDVHAMNTVGAGASVLQNLVHKVWHGGL